MSAGPPSPATGLVLVAVALHLGARRVVAADLTVAPGEIVALRGPSGAGKSTLLAHVAGTLGPAFRAEGRIRLDGVDLAPLPAERRRVGLLFQDDLLFPHLTVGGNLLFGLTASVRGRAARRAAAEAALAEAGLGGTYPRDPATLSGGERQRVALLRALLAEPRAMLLDEPFSRLDPDTRALIRGQVYATLRARRVPALVVTHDEADAEAADRTLRV